MAACPDSSNESATYAVTVTNGTGGGNYAQGATITITANTPPSGQYFKSWTTANAGVTFVNANSASTTFAMPGNVVTVTANFEATSTQTYTIGDTGPGGGKIFYYSAAGFTVEMINPSENYTAHYLEAAPTTTGTDIQWGAYGTLISGVTTITSTSSALTAKIGNGRKDTALIVAHLATTAETNRAAQICTALTTSGKNDWFLPSLGELKELYIQRTFAGISITGRYYWSSSQNNYNYAWLQGFDVGNQIINFRKDLDYYSVRAIRAF